MARRPLRDPRWQLGDAPTECAARDKRMMMLTQWLRTHMETDPDLTMTPETNVYIHTEIDTASNTPDDVPDHR